jgi:hypothetical protein
MNAPAGILSRAASEGSGGGKLGELRRISIEPAENGFEVECDHASAKKPKAGDYDPGVTERYVFGSASEMLKYLADKVGGAEDETGSDDGD